MLYVSSPYNEIPVGPQTLFQNNIAIIPLNLISGTSILLNVIHLKDKHEQDFTIQCWISKEPQGTYINYNLPNSVQYWKPSNTFGANIVELYDLNIRPQMKTSNIPAKPGPYILNILNLSNVVNHFQIVI